MSTQETVSLRLVEPMGDGSTPELLAERVAHALALAEEAVAVAVDACERAKVTVAESRGSRIG